MAEVYYKALKKWADRSYVKVITALVGAAILYMSITQGNIIYGCFGVLRKRRDCQREHQSGYF